MALQDVGERRHLVDEIHAELRPLAPLKAVAPDALSDVAAWVATSRVG